MQSASFGSDATSNFTANALAVLEPMTGSGSANAFVASDGARRLGTNKVLAAIVTPLTATPGFQLASALVQSGSQVDAVSVASGATVNAVPYGVIESLDPEAGMLYTLTQNGTTE
jgi:hypothetical protein